MEFSNEKFKLGEYVGFCWNCEGNIVGKVNGKYLYSSEGKCIGHFNENAELYDCTTHKYIGELTVIYQYIQSNKTVTSLKIDAPVSSYNEFERMIVNANKIGLQDETFGCFGHDDGFDDNSICIAINVPEGYKDFVI